MALWLGKKGVNKGDQPEDRGAHRRIGRHDDRDVMDDHNATRRRQVLRGTGLFGFSKKKEK